MPLPGNWAIALVSEAQGQTRRQTWFWIINVHPLDHAPLPIHCPPYTHGVSLHGSWCKASLINLPKLVSLCACARARTCMSLKHILQEGRQVAMKTSQSGSWLKCQWCIAERVKERVCWEGNTWKRKEKHKAVAEEDIWVSDSTRLNFCFNLPYINIKTGFKVLHLIWSHPWLH